MRKVRLVIPAKGNEDIYILKVLFMIRWRATGVFSDLISIQRV